MLEFAEVFEGAVGRVYSPSELKWNASISAIRFDYSAAFSFVLCLANGGNGIGLAATSFAGLFTSYMTA